MSVRKSTAVLPDATPLLAAAIAEQGSDAELVTLYHGSPDRSELLRRVQGHRVILGNELVYDSALLGQCPDLRTIVYLGTGASDFIDLDACERQNVHVHTIHGYGDRTVAEHTIALIFAVYRDIGYQHQAMRAGGWGGNPIGELRGKTLGIIGIGAIGREVARIAHALGMNVIAWSRNPADDGIARVSFDALLAQADIISLHLALTPETHGLVGAREFDLLRPGAVLINTARGALIDETELVTRLNDGRVAGAGLDVFAIEPLPEHHPLRCARNVVLSGHTGWKSPESITRLVEKALDLIKVELLSVAMCLVPASGGSD